MALNNFIAEIWAARLLMNLYKALVYAQTGIVNTDYEGEIRQAGDTVRINSIGAVTVSNYTKDTDIAAPQVLTDAQQILTINQQKYFNFAIDDVDRAQGRPQVMDGAMRESAYALRDGVDQYVAGLYTEADAANLIGTTASPKTDAATAGVPYNYLVDLGTLLDEANVPSEGRWCIVPSWYHGYLLKDERFVSFGTSENRGTLENGMIGEAAGFRILKSNNVPNTANDKYRVIAGHPMAISYASQVDRVEAYRPEKRFADAVKGLMLYGAKLVRPSAIAVLTIDRP